MADSIIIVIKLGAWKPEISTLVVCKSFYYYFVGTNVSDRKTSKWRHHDFQESPQAITLFPILPERPVRFGENIKMS